MDMNALYWFVKVIDAGSMSQAAKLNGVAVSTISSRIAQLEEQLQIRLLERSTRRLRLTEAGQAFYERAQLAVSSAESAQSAVQSWQQQPTGVLMMTTAPELTRSRLACFPQQLTARFPDLAVKLIQTTERLDLLQNNIDLAVRVGELDDSQLIAQRLTTCQTFVVASQAYLNKYGMPEHPEQLKEHLCIPQISFKNGLNTTHLWHFHKGEELFKFQPQGQLSTSSAGAALDFASQGMGIALTSNLLFDGESFDGEPSGLQIILPDWKMPDLPIWAIYPSRHYLPSKVREAINLMRELLATDHVDQDSLPIASDL